MHEAVKVFGDFNIACYVGLAVVALGSWLRRRDRPAMWVAAAFGVLGLLEILALLPYRAGSLGARAAGHVELALLVLFPYLLFRFTTQFRTARRTFDNVVVVVTCVLVVWAFALSLPQPGQKYGTDLEAFIGLFTVHWLVLGTLYTARLTVAGRGEPSVSRRRMQLLAFASAAITVAIAVSVAEFYVALLFGLVDRQNRVALATQILSLLAVVAFALGISPPRALRLIWQSPEMARLQHAMGSLIAHAETREEVLARVLPASAALVGARALALRDAAGATIGAWSASPEGAASDPVTVELPEGSIVAWTSPYVPFFGVDELDALRSFGALSLIALDRVRLLEAERESRRALERANELQAEFVALAAHELRTPMTTVHGFVSTLHHRAGELDPEQEAELRAGLFRQTERMAQLIEELLDLSRLDAGATDLAPAPAALRPLVEEIVAVSAPDPDAVEIEVRPDLVAVVDRHALERIVGNLVVNAFRHGLPPVRVHAEPRGQSLDLTVEDAGPGVAARFVPELFERFSRDRASPATGAGTGLGLAIARSYARAHGGDLVYERAIPHGARFRLVVPAIPARVAPSPGATPALEPDPGPAVGVYTRRAPT